MVGKTVVIACTLWNPGLTPLYIHYLCVYRCVIPRMIIANNIYRLLHILICIACRNKPRKFIRLLLFIRFLLLSKRPFDYFVALKAVRTYANLT